MRRAVLSRRTLLGGAGSLAALLASGCRPATLDADTVRIATPQFPPNQGDPFMGLTLPSTLVLDALYDSLTSLDADARARPALAVSWTETDARRWRFELRDDARFSSGRPVTAAAVAAAIALLRTPRGRRSSAGTDLAVIDRAEPVDTRRVDVVLTAPAPLLPAALSVLRIPDADAYASAGPDGFARSPVGSGPYRLVSWGPNTIRLAANPASWRSPSCAELEIVLTTDQTARLQAVLSGTVVAALDVSPDDGAVLAASGARLAPRMTTSLAVLAFVTRSPGPLRDVRVRKALNLAVDRQRIIDVFLQGRTQPANQFASDDGFGRDPGLEPIPHDPAEATRLLRAAGYESGLTLRLVAVVGNAANDAAIYQQIASDLRRVGVDLRIRRVPQPTFRQYLYHGGWPGDLFAIRMGGFDALRSFRLASCTWPAAWRCYPEVDEAVRQAQSAVDRAERERRTRAAVAADRAQWSSLFLWQDPAFDALGPRVEGWETTRASVRLEALRLEPARGY
jgi:peptide/nickel transport system substrate-binding protein